MMSFSLFFSARWNNYRRVHLYGQGAPLQSPRKEGNPGSAGAANDTDPATANDLTYEDAILGLEIRSFMQAEYGSAEPPQGVFQLLMRAIGHTLAPSRSGANYALASHVMRALNGPVTARLVPSVIAFALVLMVFGTSGMRFLSTGGTGLVSLSTTETIPTQASQTFNEVTTGPTSVALDVAGLELPIEDESQFYDRVEMRRPVLHRLAKIALLNEELQFDQYDRNGSGAQ